MKTSDNQYERKAQYNPNRQTYVDENGNYVYLIWDKEAQDYRREVCVVGDGGISPELRTIDADVIVMASPVYFYSIDAQLKAVIDRTVARWLEVKNKDFYYVVMADEDVSSADTTLACLRGYAACVRGAQEKGVLIGSGVYEPGKVKDKPAMQQAYQIGKNV